MGLQGEWWIDDSGSATFADGDIGDQNHETIAFWAALGIDPEESFLSKYGFERALESVTEYLQKTGDKFSPDEILDSLMEAVTPGYMTDAQAIGLLALGADSKAVNYFQKHSGDARGFMMAERAWIRVDDNNFQLWNLDDDALGRIRDFVTNEYPEDEDPLEDEFEIEELRKGGVHLSVSGTDLLESGKSADALKYSAQRERTGMYNPKASERTYYEIGHRGLKSKLWYGDEFNINVEDAEFDTDDKNVDPRNLHNEWALRMPWHGRYDPYSGEVSIMGGTMTEEWRQPSEQMLDRLRETFGADVKIVQFNPPRDDVEFVALSPEDFANDPNAIKNGWIAPDGTIYGWNEEYIHAYAIKNIHELFGTKPRSYTTAEKQGWIRIVTDFWVPPHHLTLDISVWKGAPWQNTLVKALTPFYRLYPETVITLDEETKDNTFTNEVPLSQFIEGGVSVQQQLRKRLDVPGAYNPPIRHAWEMSYDELLNELNSAVDQKSLNRIRPLLAEVFPEYVSVDYYDFNQDPWGIGRAIQVGTELPRIPTVDLSRRLKRMKESMSIEHNPRRRMKDLI